MGDEHIGKNERKNNDNILEKICELRVNARRRGDAKEEVDGGFREDMEWSGVKGDTVMDRERRMKNIRIVDPTSVGKRRG